MEEKQALQEAYFAESDPEKRRKLLETLDFQGEDTALLHTLWSLRYEDPEKAERRVDTFLWQIVNLICLYRVSGFFRGGAEKELHAAVGALGFSTAEPYGSAGRETLYLEFRNAAQRYFSTCENKSYGKKLMGFVTMNEKERREKLAREVWQLTEGLPGRFECDADAELFFQAVREEFLDQCPDGQKLLAAQKNRREKKRSA